MICNRLPDKLELIVKSSEQTINSCELVSDSRSTLSKSSVDIGDILHHASTACNDDTVNRSNQ